MDDLTHRLTLGCRNAFRRLVLGVLLALLSPYTYAGACGGVQPYLLCSDVQVLVLYIESGGGAYIKVDGNPESMPCTLSAGYILLPGNDTKFNAIYATLLTAQSTGRRVGIRLTTATQCTVAYVTLAA